MRNPLGCRLSSNFISEVTHPEILAQERAAQAKSFAALEESLSVLMPQQRSAGPQSAPDTTVRGIRTPLGCRLTESNLTEGLEGKINTYLKSKGMSQSDWHWENGLNASSTSTAKRIAKWLNKWPDRTGTWSAKGKKVMSEDSPLEAPIGGFNRHQKLMSPATRELVLKSRQTEIEAFAEDRGYDPAMIFAIAEVAMRTGRVPDMRQYGFAGDDAKAIKHYVAGEILNLAIEDIEQMERDLAEAHRGHSASAAKMTGEYSKHASRDRKFSKKQASKKGRQHGKKETQRQLDTDIGYGEFLAEMHSPEAVQKFHDLLQKNFVKIKERLATPGELAKYVVRLARSAGLKPLDAIGPAMTYVMQHAKMGKLKKQTVGHIGEDLAASIEQALIDEAKNRKLHPSMIKHINAPHFKAHSGDPKDQKPPFHKGKGLKAESDTTYGEYLAARR